MARAAGSEQAAADGGSAASSAGYSGSTTSSPYTTGEGPGFDPRTPPTMQESPADQEARGDLFAEAWEVEQVQGHLRTAGELAHGAFGVAQRDWELTERDLERIGEPLARILNRYEPTRAVAAFSDPAAVAVGFGLYGWRSSLERMHALKAAQQAADEAAPGGVAPGFTPPPPEAGPPPGWSAAANGTPAPAPVPEPGPGQPGHIPVEDEHGQPMQSFADQLKQTRPPEDQ